MANNIDAQDKEKIKATFKANDSNGDGKLSFDNFLTILKALDEGYSNEDAQTLFQISDQDLSGDLDFDEFVEWVCGNENMNKLFELEDSVSEEEAKEALLTKPVEIRKEAARIAREGGTEWKQMPWKDRLEAVKELEKSAARDDEKAKAKAPCNNTSSNFTARRTQAQPQSPVRTKNESVSEHIKVKEAPAAPKIAPAPQSRFAVGGMSQEKMVEYSLKDDEIAFSQFDYDVMCLRDQMKKPCPPEDTLDITKFIAKGTAGWVFLVKDKETGTEAAMKIVRMTQAPSGVKEWYVSKRLNKAEVQNVVYTYETVFVLVRSIAPPVIKEQLVNAGPCEYYMCTLQEVMPWGTLEDMAEAGELTPEIMFRAMEDVSGALAAMHDNNIAHKDVKPENIMLEVQGDTVVAAKLCDFGIAEIGNSPSGRANDIRRFGVTLYSVATGEMWTKNRLIHAKHDDLVERITKFVKTSEDPQMKRLPEVLKQILDGGMTMREVANLMAELESAY